MSELEKVKWLYKLGCRQMLNVKTTYYDIAKLHNLKTQLQKLEIPLTKRVGKGVTVYHTTADRIDKANELKRQLQQLEERINKPVIVAFRYLNLGENKLLKL